LKELLRSNDVVHLSWIKSVFDEVNISIFVMDEQMSVLEGSANAIPRRFMVSEEDYAQAIKILEDARSDLDG
jgi:hypothetical protein